MLLSAQSMTSYLQCPYITLQVWSFHLLELPLLGPLLIGLVVTNLIYSALDTFKCQINIIIEMYIQIRIEQYDRDEPMTIQSNVPE